MSGRNSRHVALLAVLALAGCGGDSGPSAAEKAASERRQEKAAEAREKREAKVRAKACEQHYRELLDELEETQSRLGIGLTYVNYLERVADVKVVYDRTSSEEIEDIPCLSDVGVPAETALRHYTRAASRWQRCIEAPECSTDSIDGKLQSSWREAARLTRSAQRGLDALERP